MMTAHARRVGARRDTWTRSATARRTRAFAGRPASVAEARAWVAALLPRSPAADAVVLMVSELVTNAILHSASRRPGGVVTVRVTVRNSTIRVNVVDEGPGPVCMAAPGGLGAGLVIVSQLADVFGADGPDRWFTLRIGAQRQAHR